MMWLAAAVLMAAVSPSVVAGRGVRSRPSVAAAVTRGQQAGFMMRRWSRSTTSVLGAFKQRLKPYASQESKTDSNIPRRRSALSAPLLLFAASNFWGTHKKLWQGTERNSALVKGCPDPDILVKDTIRSAEGLGDKVAIVTGANTGLGKETVVQMARMGVGTIIMAVRSPERGEAARREILESFPEDVKASSLQVRKLDLASLASVRSFAEQVLKQEERIDILVNNAGVMATPQMTTEEGFDYQLGINHLGHFLLTNLLIDRIIETGKKHGEDARIINVSSTAHLFGKMNFEDLMLQKRNNYGSWKAYGQSKLANVLFTRELAERLNEIKAPVSVNVLHPGVVSTDLQRYLIPEEDSPMKKIMESMKDKLLVDARKGAGTQVFLATSPKVKGISGVYFDNCKNSEALTSAESRNVNEAHQLWAESVKLVGLPQNYNEVA